MQQASWTTIKEGAGMLDAQEIDRLLHEHQVLLRSHADAQARCSALLREQAEQLRTMDAQLIRTRAALVRSQTALAWEREDRAVLERSIPGLGSRATLGRQVAALQGRVRALMGELHRGALFSAPTCAAPPQAMPAPDDLSAELETSLEAADLVICQTGCMSHGDYWRVHDHCKRTGKLCVLVERSDGPQFVRIQRGAVRRADGDLVETLTGQR